MTPYQRLGIARTASRAQIRRAYLRLSKSSHPDAGGTAEEFVTLAEAYAILSDPERRKRYDETGDGAPKPRDATREQAIALVANMLANILMGDHEPKSLNLLLILRDGIQAQINEITLAIAAHERAKLRVEALCGRFSRVRTTEDDKDNLLEAILRGHAARIDQAIKTLTERRGVFQYAQTMLADYSFSQDAVVQRMFTVASGQRSTAVYFG